MRTFRRKSLLLSGLAFLCFSLLILLIARVPGLSAEPTADSTVFSPTGEDTLRLLLTGVGDGGQEAEIFLLVCFCPAEDSVSVVGLPACTEVQTDGHSKTLAEAFRYGGAGYVRNALQDTLGIVLDRFVRIPAEALPTMADTLGRVEFSLDQPVSIDRAGTTVTLEAGVRQLDGQRLLELISAQTDPLERSALAASLTAAAINQHMDVALSDSVDAVFVKLINLVKTDLSYNDYSRRKQAAAYLAEAQPQPAVVLPVEGQFDGNETVYRLSDTCIVRLAQSFA